MTNEQAIQTLRQILNQVVPNSPDKCYRIASQIRDAKESVISKYAPLFSLENLDKLTVDDFKSFLLFKNNQHWASLHRQNSWMTADMDKLREALKLLINESLPVKIRLNKLRPNNGDPMVKGLGRAVITAILQVVYPEKYGVVNNTAEKGMTELTLWPKFPRGYSFGERYDAINKILLEVAEGLGIDLWTLDMLWWRAAPTHTPGRGATNVEEETEAVLEGTVAEGTFGLEKYLHEFLVDNWDVTELSDEWSLLEEDGEIVGSHYYTGEVGEIDLLAKHKSDKKWLVIELKKNQSSDSTVGQILRYMSWVRKNRAADREVVEGLIICRLVDRKLQYALDGLANIKCMTYQVTFNLNATPELE